MENELPSSKLSGIGLLPFSAPRGRVSNPIQPNENKLINFKPNCANFPVKINIHFFEGEKTENASAKKKGKARGEGQVAKSQEVTVAVLFLVMFSSLNKYAGYMFAKLENMFNYNLDVQLNYTDTFNEGFMSKYMGFAFEQVLLTAMPMLATALFIGIVTNLFQVGWHPTFKPLQPKFSKLNLISGFKRMFSMQSILTLFKSVSKFALICWVVYSSIKDQMMNLPLLFEFTVNQTLAFIGSLIIKIGMNVGMVYVVIAIIDYSYAKWKHNKDLKMSKQEVKEEYKSAEGNPQIKGKIRQKMREASMRRMMSDLPTADVIITNPTHYAVAIKYDRETSIAPIVVAKGADHMAKRIREVAKENNIQFVENKPLARTLYSTVEIGAQIPPELYKTVAEILAYVYKLKGTV